MSPRTALATLKMLGKSTGYQQLEKSQLKICSRSVKKIRVAVFLKAVTMLPDINVLVYSLHSRMLWIQWLHTLCVIRLE